MTARVQGTTPGPATPGPAISVHGPATSVPGATALDPASAVPLYAQLEEVLLRRVEAGEWPAGAQIPTESQLCEAYGVSRVTVRQALGRLARRGLLSRGRGRGTFVRDARLTAGARSVSSFSAELSERGMRPGSRVLDVGEVPATAEVATALGREPGTTLIRLRRVRLGDGLPIGVQSSLLVAERFPGLAAHLGDDVSLYEVLRTRYGTAPVEATEVFRVTGMPREIAPLLEVGRGTHGFHATRVTYDGREAFEHTTSYLRGDRYEIRLSLRNTR
ncbi:GntR family transcriptional regulator [Georgenia soli]|uniref:GntR family transcriptional regulator n=1 Tax=Georgenia soli TaxID=638953 RepID=A0A2A9ERD1_9MICO|nr:GntR family transcriptional regulator [Georgenia soli]PFG41146.1 GntR family transcriptional regulator [Georgenia soli]